MKTLLISIYISVMAISLCSQESVRNIKESGYHTKYLTPNQVDTWKINVAQNETLIVHVRTEDFDPTLKLATKDDRILIEVDDDGSQSRFAMRLAQEGQYHILVHGFKYQGGGNYELKVDQFLATSVIAGIGTVGTFNHDGRAHHYFQAKQGQILLSDITGSDLRNWDVLNPKGAEITELWQNSFRATQTGEYYLLLYGRPGFNYNVLLRQARVKTLEDNKNFTGQLEPKEIDVWNLRGECGQFREIEVLKRGMLSTRLVYIPEDKPIAKVHSPRQKDIHYFPVASKGAKNYMAVLLGKTGEYELHIVSQSPASYKLRMQDPTRALGEPAKEQGTIVVGGSIFYTFTAAVGELFQIDLQSSQFDPLLRLYNEYGELVAENDDGTDLSSHIQVMIWKHGNYRLQIAALGNGGSGPYNLNLWKEKIGDLKIGERANGELGANDRAYWSFQGEKGKSILINIRSSDLDPSVQLYSPNGVVVGEDDNSGVGTDALLAAMLSESGRYSICIDNRRGQGAYSIRLIDGD